MKDTFERLAKMAKKEFDCVIIRSNTKSSFRDLFGVDVNNIQASKNVGGDAKQEYNI